MGERGSSRSDVRITLVDSRTGIVEGVDSKPKGDDEVELVVSRIVLVFKNIDPETEEEEKQVV
jgi:hypothetical protein